MLVTWLRTSWRNILRNKFFALVSMSSLTIGCLACLFIWLVCAMNSVSIGFNLIVTELGL
jgi:hypothetical protein